MSTDLSSELLAYHAFVKTTLSKGGSLDEDATPAAFLEYQHQLNQLRTSLQAATERFRRGEGAIEIDVDEFVDEVLRSSQERGQQD